MPKRKKAETITDERMQKFLQNCDTAMRHRKNPEEGVAMGDRLGVNTPGTPLENFWKDFNKAEEEREPKVVSDGSTASYYELPTWAEELQDLIRFKEMNGAQAEIFRALFRGDSASHSGEQRQALKVLCYAVDEVVRTHFPNKSFVDYRNRVMEVFFPVSKEP